MGVQNNLSDQSNHVIRNKPREILPVRFSVAMSPQPSIFSPLLFAGKLGEGIEILAKEGFSAVEVSLRQTEDLDIEWFANRLQELGLGVSAFATGRMCLEESLCLSNLNPIVRRQVYDRLSALIKLAARFKASLIIGGVRGKLSGERDQRKEQRAVAIDTLRRYAAVAQDLGINLLLEPINRYETNFINSSLDGLEFIEEIDHPAVRLLLDTFHMNIEEVDPCLAIRKAGNRLAYVHFADNNRLAPGQGHINFPAIIQTLIDIGYCGYIAAEILPIPDDVTALIQTGRYLNSLKY